MVGGADLGRAGGTGPLCGGLSLTDLPPSLPWNDALPQAYHPLLTHATRPGSAKSDKSWTPTPQRWFPLLFALTGEEQRRKIAAGLSLGGTEPGAGKAPALPHAPCFQEARMLTPVERSGHINDF